MNRMIREEYHKLGPVSYAEWSVLACFFLLAFYWITRDLGEVGGWSKVFNPKYVSDSTPAILIGSLMFVLPATFPTSISSGCDPDAQHKTIRPLLRWQQVRERMPWALYLLLGGGFALARATTVSGLATWLWRKLMIFKPLNDWLILTIICYISCFVTEVTSNTATATLLMPILSQLALALETNPLFFMFPAAITTSFAFMLPGGTPPNAIVFGTGALRAVDMVFVGFIMSILCPLVLIFAVATWGDAFFKFSVMPPEFIRNMTKLS